MDEFEAKNVLGSIVIPALAENSALNDCVPSNRLRAYPQQWLPGESNN